MNLEWAKIELQKILLDLYDFFLIWQLINTDVVDCWNRDLLRFRLWLAGLMVALPLGEVRDLLGPLVITNVGYVAEKLI